MTTTPSSGDLPPDYVISGMAKTSIVEWATQVAAHARYLAVLTADAAGSHKSGRVVVQPAHVATAFRVILQDVPSVVNAVVVPADKQRPVKPAAATPAESLLTLAEVERQVILSRMQQFGGRRGAVAASCNIGLRTLYDKLKQYAAADAKSADASGK